MPYMGYPGPRPQPPKKDESDEQTAVFADHLFVFTITGECLRCKRREDAHPRVREVTEVGPDECTVDHTSIQPARLINDGGVEWRRCPICDSLVEPKLATGIMDGNPYDPGRGDPTPRLLKKLMAWVGWVDWQGKGR